MTLGEEVACVAGEAREAVRMRVGTPGEMDALYLGVAEDVSVVPEAKDDRSEVVEEVGIREVGIGDLDVGGELEL